MTIAARNEITNDVQGDHEALKILVARGIQVARMGELMHKGNGQYSYLSDQVIPKRFSLGTSFFNQQCQEIASYGNIFGCLTIFTTPRVWSEYFLDLVAWHADEQTMRLQEIYREDIERGISDLTQEQKLDRIFAS